MATERMGDGGPAFPERAEDGTCYSGATLRDYAAFHAPISLHDAMKASGQGDDLRYGLQGAYMGQAWLFQAHAKLAYMWADAMLAARSQP